MISYDQVLGEMARQLGVARSTADERTMREALSAIRSLCDVALGAGEVEVVQPKIVHGQNTQSSALLEGKPLTENDANGGSIFDF